MSVYCKIEYSEDGRLSITGVEGPLPSGNCLGACGQIDMDLKARYFIGHCAAGWDVVKIAKLLDVWDRWHLNDMHAGTPEQEQLIRDFRKMEAGKNASYEAVKGYLSSVQRLMSVHPQTGQPYVYGTGWLFEAVPDDVLEWLMALPDADKAPAWV